MKQTINAKILENHLIAPDIYKMVLGAEDVAKQAKPGQFVNLYCKGKETLLPRPISISEIDKENGTITLIYAVVGKGTAEFSNLQIGEGIEVLGPLGNGFEVQKEKKQNIIIGGGIGAPPLLELVKHLEGKKAVYLGFRTNPILVEEFKKYGAEVYVATDDGSEGYKGTVIDLLEQQKAEGDMIYSCGPKVMLKAAAQWAAQKQIPAQVSLEERMGCGIGACVGCVCKIKVKTQEDWEYKKVCKDGPVFWGNEVIWDE